MFDFLTNFEITLGCSVASLIAGVIFSTKIKDYVKGVPAQARVALNNIEAQALNSVKQAQADALAKLPGAVVAKVPLPPAAAPIVAAPVAPVAPVAPPAAPAPAAPTA